MTITVVAAVARNGVIGRDGDMPWHLPDDLRHFKVLTLGGTLVMGRKTYDSIGRPLPGRTTVVVTRQPDWAVPGVTTVHSLDDALAAAAAPDADTFVVGGAEIYAMALPLADRLVITEVDRSPDGDARFPDVDWSAWRETGRERHDGFSFVTYERDRPGPVSNS